MIRHCDARKRKKRSEICVGGNQQQHLPDDLLIECILCRFPLQCLFRCTAVCKAWRRLVKETHALYGGTTMTKHALALGYVNIRIITPTSPRDGNKDSEAPIDITRHYPREWIPCDGNDGLLLYCNMCCIDQKSRTYTFHVCNPLTLKSVPLPIIRWLPGQPFYHLSMLIFDPAVSHHYKVIAIFGSVSKKSGGRRLYNKLSIFSSEQAHLGWRRLKGRFPEPPNEVFHSFDKKDDTVCFNGCAYRLGYRTVDNYARAYNNVVIRFYVKEESFELFDSPPALDVTPVSNVWSALDKAHGYLQYIHNDLKNVRIWKLQEDGRSWSSRHRVRLSDDIRHYPRDACVLLSCNNDEVLLFVGTDRFLYQYNMNQRKLECYHDNDGRPVTGGKKSLRPFLCCAIDPEFRRFFSEP